MGDICVIGDYDSICGYQALGLTVFAAYTAQEARLLIRDIADRTKVICITEPLAEQISDTLEEYSGRYLPAILPIPAIHHNTGFALSCVQKAVKQAAGSDILFGD